MYVYMHACIHACMYMHICINAHVFADADLHEDVDANVRVYVYIYVAEAQVLLTWGAPYFEGDSPRVCCARSCERAAEVDHHHDEAGECRPGRDQPARCLLPRGLAVAVIVRQFRGLFVRAPLTDSFVRCMKNFLAEGNSDLV